MLGSLYKLSIKVLANGLEKVVGKVVSKFQNAFMEGKQIFYTILIVNRVINSILKCNKCDVLCKLDIKKAYNYVNQNFLLSILKKIGFGKKGIGLIK